MAVITPSSISLRCSGVKFDAHKDTEPKRCTRSQQMKLAELTPFRKTAQ